LIVINASLTNNAAYQITSGVDDDAGYIYIKNANDPPGLYYELRNFFLKYTDGSTFRYISPIVNHSMVHNFNAGDQIVVGARVVSTGTPTGNWNISYVTGNIIRIK